MSAAVRTVECFPREIVLAPDWVLPAGEPRHAECVVGHHVPGVLGGWHCPCPCHATNFCGCCGNEIEQGTADWCMECLRDHVDTFATRPEEATFYAQHGVDCPNQTPITPSLSTEPE